MITKEDKGFVIMGPELENGGRAALRIDKDGVRSGEMFREGQMSDCDCEVTRIETKQISGSIYEVTEEEPVGRPSMVNSLAYRNNWNNIFGNKQEIGAS